MVNQIGLVLQGLTHTVNNLLTIYLSREHVTEATQSVTKPQ